MNIDDYLIDLAEADWNRVLQPWHWALPEEFVLWLANRFGDLFVVIESGEVYMLDVGLGTFERRAGSRDEFCDRLDQDDHANEWLMIPLVDQLVAAGKELGRGDCYSYICSPVAGGQYDIDNTMVVPIVEHYALTSDFHRQIKDAPDGTPVRIRVKSPPC